MVDRHDRRLRDRARVLGFADLHGYLEARCQQHASLTQLAGELGTTPLVTGRLLDHAGIQRPPQPQLTAISRRRATDQRLTARAAELGFPTLRANLTDRVVERGWPLTTLTGELR